jgi:hypothetical protein
MSSVFWLPSDGSERHCLWLRPRGGEWLCEDVLALRQEGVEVVVSMLTVLEEQELGLNRESAVVREVGMAFYAWPLRDREIPDSMFAWGRRFRALEPELCGRSIAVHCRQGIGRSSLWLAAWRAWEKKPVSESLTLLEKVRGRPVPDTAEQIDWLQRWEEWLKLGALS